MGRKIERYSRNSLFGLIFGLLSPFFSYAFTSILINSNLLETRIA